MRMQNIFDTTCLADGDITLKITATAIFGSGLPAYSGVIPTLKYSGLPDHKFTSVVAEMVLV